MGTVNFSFCEWAGGVFVWTAFKKLFQKVIKLLGFFMFVHWNLLQSRNTWTGQPTSFFVTLSQSNNMNSSWTLKIKCFHSNSSTRWATTYSDLHDSCFCCVNVWEQGQIWLMTFPSPDSLRGRSKTKDSLKTGFNVRFFTCVFFFEIRWPLYIR